VATMTAHNLDKMRDEDTGKLISLAWPGGYPVVYYSQNGDEFCAECADKEMGMNHSDAAFLDPITDYDVHYEGPSIFCSDCGVEIESAYGDPDAEDGA
jgi:hypothetical protein